MAPAMPASQKNCMDPFQKHKKECTSKYMPRPLSYSGQLLDSFLTDRLDMVSVKDDSTN